MKTLVISIILISSMVGGFIGYGVKPPVEGVTIERYIPIDSTDSIIHKVNNTKHIIDSLTCRCDSLTGELQVAKYKLERIRYYNDIAKKGNNIVFLRGWLNRVLNEDD